jgi:dihydroorotase
VCIFNPARYWKVTPAALKSQGKNTPFIGCEMSGQVSHTIIDGQVVYEVTAASAKR